MCTTKTQSVSKWEWWSIGFGLLLGFCLRLLNLWIASDLPFFRHHRLDAQVYHEAGLRFARGDWWMGSDVLHMSPLYSYIVGLFYSIGGPSPWGLAIFQMLLGTALIALTWDIARRCFGAWWGLTAGWLVACYGPLIFYESHLLAVTIGAFLWTLLLWLGVQLCFDIHTKQEPQHFQRRSWLALGIVWGLCILLRPNALLLGPVLLFLCVAIYRRQAWQPFLWLTLYTSLLILPVTLRNRLIAGEWILVTDSGGLNFYIGNGLGATGTFRAPAGLEAAKHPAKQFVIFRRVAEAVSQKSLTSKQVDAFWFTRTWREIRKDWGRWLRLIRDKCWLFWGAAELSNNQDYTFTRQINPLLGAPLIQFGWIAPFALWGLIWISFNSLLALYRRQSMTPETLAQTWIAMASWVLFAAVVCFFVLARYRLTGITGLIILSIGGIRQLCQWLQQSNVSRTSVVLTLIALSYPWIYTTWLERSIATEYFKLGFAYHIQRRPDKAEESY
ncbi:MAG: glycosyltransferase family 39 protein, partial [Myxococcota bacterium]